MRLSTTPLVATDATAIWMDRSSSVGRGRWSGTAAPTRCSNRVVLPEPLWPTSTTLRRSSGRLGTGTEPTDAALALMTTRWPLAGVGTTPSRRSVLWAHHAEPIRASLLHQALHPRRPAAPAARRQSRHRDRRRHRGCLLRSPGLLPPARVLLGHDRHHGLRLLRHRRRGDGADVGALQQLGGLPRLHAGPGGRQRHLRWAGPLLRR